MDLKKRNDAVDVNGPSVNGDTADIALTDDGSSAYFAICAIMGFSTVVFLFLGHRKPRQNRVFYYLTGAITMVAFIAYFTMGSHLGWTSIEVEFRRSDSEVRGITREIYYVRYIDWFITTPLLLMDLLLTAGMPWVTILYVILIDWIMIITGLIGALVSSSYKWGYFTFGCAAFLYIVYMLAYEARLHARNIGGDVGKVFFMCGSLTLFLWFLYPIAWGLCEGGNVISVDAEVAFYGTLDVLAKPVFGALLIWGHRNIDPGRLGLRIRDYTQDPAVHRSTVGDKDASAQA